MVNGAFLRAGQDQKEVCKVGTTTRAGCNEKLGASEKAEAIGLRFGPRVVRQNDAVVSPVTTELRNRTDEKDASQALDALGLQDLLRGGLQKPKKFRTQTEILHQIEIASVNTGGVPGVYRLIEMVKSGHLVAKVLCIQELRANSEDIRVLENRLGSLGFYTYLQSGGSKVDGAGITRHHGGVMTAVHKSLKQKQMHQARNEKAQVLVVEVHGWEIANFYNPPRELEKLHDIMIETLVMVESSARTPWICCGDFNEKPDETTATIMAAFGMKPVPKIKAGQGPTRWAGEDEIDWFATNRAEQVEESWQNRHKISDHKIQSTRIQIQERRPCKVGKLKPGPDWRCPEHLDKKQWRAKLHELWQQTAVKQLFDITAGPTTLSVEEDWRQWMMLLDEFYREAYALELMVVDKALNEAQLDSERQRLLRAKAWITKQLKNKRTKGLTIDYVLFSEPIKARLEEDKAGWKTTYRKQVGRLCSMRRLLKKHGIKGLEANQEMKDLQKKVQLHTACCNDTSEAIDWINAVLARKERELKRDSDAQKKNKLEDWRERMQDLREAAKWIKNKSRTCTRLISGAQTRDEVCKKIRQFWIGEWSSLTRKTTAQDEQDTEEALLQPIREWVRDKQLPEWTADDRREGMRRAFPKARGAAGPDGYRGEEVAVLPEGLQEVFCDVCDKWIEQRTAPANLRKMIQASLQKPGKPAVVENVRPLAVFSVFWRLFESGVLRSDAFVSWRKEVGIEEVAWKESAEEVAAAAGNCFATDGYLGALDFSKAYDFMEPKKSARILIEAGVPKDIAELFGQHWSGQIRYITFDGHMSQEELTTTTAHPQGGPWGPVVIQLWMIAGTLWTKKQAENETWHHGQNESSRGGAPDPLLWNRISQKRCGKEDNRLKTFQECPD